MLQKGEQMLPNVDLKMVGLRKKCGRQICTIAVVHRKEMHMKESFGERIRRLRMERKLKQEQVAAILQVNRKAVSHYENDIREPSFETLIQLAELYRVSSDYLLGIESGPSIKVSGLTEKEISLVRELVSIMEARNRRLERYLHLGK